jgi:hypothetical protein
VELALPCCVHQVSVAETPVWPKELPGKFVLAAPAGTLVIPTAAGEYCASPSVAAVCGWMKRV